VLPPDGKCLTFMLNGPHREKGAGRRFARGDSMDILEPALIRIEAMARDFAAQLPNIVIGLVAFFLF
jgi:hypothetical protein